MIQLLLQSTARSSEMTMHMSTQRLYKDHNLRLGHVILLKIVRVHSDGCSVSRGHSTAAAISASRPDRVKCTDDLPQ
jgi:hypothetical protein